MTTLFTDIKYAFRQLRMNPGFTAVAVISLALGIGANTGIFSILNAILLRSLPVPNPQALRVVTWAGNVERLSGFTGSIEEIEGRHVSGTFSYPTFRDFQERAAGQAEVFAFFPVYNLATQTRGTVGTSSVMMVSGNYFGEYGARPQIGRLLTTEDDRVGSAPVAVVTHRFWQRRCGGAPDVLGQMLGINGNPFTVVGVLPPDYAGPMTGDPTDVYVPMSMPPHNDPDVSLSSYDKWWVLMMARLAPGTSDAQLHSLLAGAFAETFDQSGTRINNAVIVLEEGRRGLIMERSSITPSLYALQGVVATVLLIACANLAGLMLARGAGRRREYAMCAAVGADRWRLMRKPLVESLLLSLGGAGVGLLCGMWVKAGLLRFMPDVGVEMHLDARTDGMVLLFMVLLTLVTALLCGLLPAWRAARIDPLEGLQQSGRTGGLGRQRLGRVLVALQVALSLFLVAGAGLFLRSIDQLRKLDPGFDTEKLLLFSLNADQPDYTEERRGRFFAQVQDELAGIPGVKSVTSSNMRLLAGSSSQSGFAIPGRERRPDESWQAHLMTVGDGFFPTMDIPLLHGRDFMESDVADGQPVVIINDLLAQRHYPDQNPIGQTLEMGRDRAYRIIGVCGSTLYTDVRADKPITIYFPMRQKIPNIMHFAVRSALAPATLVSAVRQVIGGIDPAIPPADISTQAAQFDHSIFMERTFAALCSGLGSLAVLLSCIGLYGLLAYGVARRTAEIGMRMALGAQPSDVARVILRDALVMALWGIVLGLPLALGLGFVARSALYGVTPYDPGTLIAAVAALLLAAVGAAWLPARRAAKIDPMEALRYE